MVENNKKVSNVHSWRNFLRVAPLIIIYKFAMYIYNIIIYAIILKLHDSWIVNKHACFKIISTGKHFNHRIIPSLISKTNPVIIDAGANIGKFSDKLIKLFRIHDPQIFLVECQRGVIDELKKNIKHNDRMILIEKALIGNNKIKELEFYEIKGRIKPDGSYRYNEWGNLYNVNIPKDEHEIRKYKGSVLL